MIRNIFLQEKKKDMYQIYQLICLDKYTVDVLELYIIMDHTVAPT